MEEAQQQPPLPDETSNSLAQSELDRLWHFDKGALSGSSDFYLEVDAIQSEPPLENIFLESGGAINAAASRGDTDFAVTGSVESVVANLSDTYSSTVRIPIPADHISLHVDKPMTVELDSRAKLLICTSRKGAGINGSLVSTVAGQTAVYLSKIMRTASPHVAIPLQYANWASHSAVVCGSNLRIVDNNGRHYNVHFLDDEKRDAVLKASENFLSAWADGAWTMRQKHMIYKHSPSLTKAVAKVPVGLNDCGYDLVHNVINAPHPQFSWTTIDSLYKQAISVELEFCDDEIAAFIEDTKQPGLCAAKHGRTVAASLSTLAAFLVNYRADGRTNIMPTGSVAVSAESWMRQVPRSPIEANDCDGSAISIINLVHACETAPSEIVAKFPFVGAVKNVVFPFYTVGVSVLGATSAEASGGGTDSEHQQLAGHAATLMVPTVSLLRALERGSKRTTDEGPAVDSDKQLKVASARFNAFFPMDSVVESLPEEDRVHLKSWETARNAKELSLEAFALEGTTPASPFMYATGETAATALETAKNDKRAFEKIGPTIGRSIKLLYVGGRGASPHRFYHDFVEYTVSRSSPLWTDTHVRDLGAASSQFVFTRHSGSATSVLNSAGISPRELATESYAAVPLVVVDTPTSAVIDFASQAADMDVMPPRGNQNQVLDEFQSAQLEKSLDALKQLNESMSGRDPGDGHTVAYIIGYSTLVNNPAAVLHLCTRIKSEAHAGMVDSLEIDGLMKSSTGLEAGKMVVINAVVPL